MTSGLVEAPNRCGYNPEYAMGSGGVMRFIKVLLALALASMVAACATQQAMTVSASAVANPSPKYKNAVVVRSVAGGAPMDALTRPGVPNEPLKAAL